jgi:DeoR/GlpR family transcriptional regulator of sugar metabolism
MIHRNVKLSQNKRLETIRDTLLEKEEVFVHDLAKMFNVSLMTVHRDLEILEKAGEVIKTHGGATAAKKLTFEFSFRNQVSNHQEQKEKIAQKAVEIIKQGDVVMLDTGTTMLEVAKKLKGKEGITVITTSLAVVSELQFAGGIEIILLGGYLRSGSPDLHGPLTEDDIERFRTNIAFIGADGIDLNGNTFTDDLRIAVLSRGMAKNSEKVVVVSDSSKIGRKAMCKVLSSDEYDLIITNSNLDDKILKSLKLNRKKIEFVK